MTEQMESPKEPKIELEGLANIRLLGDLANGVQNEKIKNMILSMSSGDILYKIFIEAVDIKVREILNPNKALQKEVTDIMGATQALRLHVEALYNAMQEIGNSPIMMALGTLYQKITGNQMSQPTEKQQAQQQFQQAQAQQQQQFQQPRTGGRGSSDYIPGGGVGGF